MKINSASLPCTLLRARSDQAFSLVELSIVLVILGLLVGGVLGGQSLIKAAQLRGVITDIDKYKIAFNAFKLKYNAIPGDMRNATSYWGSGTVDTPIYNGTGNGRIDWFESMGEPLQAWRHLSLAGLIEGNMTGSYPSEQQIAGLNIPASKYRSDVGYELSYIGTSYASAYYVGDFKNVLFFAAAKNLVAGAMPVLSAPDAANVDAKVDDGKPASGNIVAPYYNTNCVTATDQTAIYKLSTGDTEVCGFMIKTGI